MAKPISPTPLERLVQADAELERLSSILEKLWLERHAIYGCIRDVKKLRRNLELARATVERKDGT